MARVKAELDAEKLPNFGLQSLLAGSNNRVPLLPPPGSKFQLLDSEGLSLDERLTVDEARELQKNLRRLMEGGDLGAVTLSGGENGKNVIRIPPHVVMSTLRPSDLSVERRIHEAYKNQRFIGRDFEEAEETPYSTKLTFDPSSTRVHRTTPTPPPGSKSSTKRAFVVKKRKKAEALAARARQLKGQEDS